MTVAHADVVAVGAVAAAVVVVVAAAAAVAADDDGIGDVAAQTDDPDADKMAADTVQGSNPEDHVEGGRQAAPVEAADSQHRAGTERQRGGLREQGDRRNRTEAVGSTRSA
jgi:hypothetical protein